MKLLLYCSLYFFSLQLFGQGIKVVEFKQKYYQGDSIVITLKNIDTINWYVNIQLEKKMNNEWMLFTKDIFSPPFADIMLAKILLANTTNKYKLALPKPEWFEEANWTDKYRKRVRARINYGSFRYKIYLNNKNENDFPQFLNSPCFFIHQNKLSRK